MEGHSHDSVCGVEGLLHSVPMVDVYIDEQHPLVVPEMDHSSTVVWDHHQTQLQ